MLIFSNDSRQRRRQREEQDAEYKRAEEQDRLRLEAEQRRIDEEKRRVEMAQQRVNQRANLVTKVRQERLQLRGNLPAEANAADKQNTCLVRIRFPDGSQVQRRFVKSTSANALYEFVHTVNLDLQDVSFTKWKPHECSTLENYELSTMHPKKRIDPLKTLEENGCYPHAVVLVMEDNPFMHEQIEESH